MRLTVTNLIRNNLDEFRRLLRKSRHLLVITGAGISAESGIPTYRSTNGLWRNLSVEKLATPMGFNRDPSTVWEFYHYRREMVLKATPNAAHYAVAECEKWFEEKGSKFTLVTTNVDGLHRKAGSKNLIEVHGCLLETRCTVCDHVEENLKSPICEALRGTEKKYYKNFEKSTIPREHLPHCQICGGLLRPNVVWFYEAINRTLEAKTTPLLKIADMGVVIGLSSTILPVGLYGSRLIEHGAVVADFNIKMGPYTRVYSYFFKGAATDLIPRAFDKDWELRSSDS